MSWEKINTLNLLWSSICSDDDGQNISACVSDGGIYYSNNGGTEWNKYNIPDNDWQFICSNSSGTCLAACVYNGGIWIYTNFNGWIQTDAPINYWRCICSDSTGQYLNAVAYNNSYVYSSSDYGKTWHSNIIDELQNMYYSICSDSGGNYLKVSTHGCIYSCFNGQNLKQTWIINNITYFNTGSLLSTCSSKITGANGLNFCLRLISLTLSFISGPLGSANKLRLPNARGPNSALPLATPTILFSFSSLMTLSTG
jgi:hypothetical protein